MEFIIWREKAVDFARVVNIQVVRHTKEIHDLLIFLNKWIEVIKLRILYRKLTEKKNNDCSNIRVRYYDKGSVLRVVPFVGLMNFFEHSNRFNEKDRVNGLSLERRCTKSCKTFSKCFMILLSCLWEYHC